MDAQKCDLCRLCLEPVNGSEEILLNNNDQLIRSILLITGLKVVSDPGQCEFLCGQCLCLLEQCVEFREKCINNDGAFREMMIGLKGGLNRVEDSKSDLPNPQLQHIKQEPVDFGEPAGDVSEALVKDHLLPDEVSEAVVLKEEYDDGTEHRKPKLDPRMVQCPQCGIVVVRSKLEEHQETHSSNPRKFACPYCFIGFLYIEDQQEHINTIHTHESQFVCNQCGKAYANRNSFSEHHRAKHTSVKRYSCTICGERFNRAGRKSRHMRVVHSTDRPFTCEYCKKTFVSKSDVIRHTTFHCTIKKAQEVGQPSAARPVKPEGKNHDVAESSKAKKSGSGVQCQQCDKWVLPHYMSKHLKIHSPSRKKLSCPHCPKQYFCAKSLRDHIHAVHTPGVLYACDECGKSFATRNSFYDHRALVHNDNKRYECKDCGERFAEVQILSKHRWKEHLT